MESKKVKIKITYSSFEEDIVEEIDIDIPINFNEEQEQQYIRDFVERNYEYLYGY